MLDTPVSQEQYTHVQSQLIDMLGERNAYRWRCDLLEARIETALRHLETNPIPDRHVLTELLSP